MPWRLFAVLVLSLGAAAGELEFRHHYIDRDLPTSAEGNGDYGLTGLADLVNLRWLYDYIGVNRWSSMEKETIDLAQKEQKLVE